MSSFIDLTDEIKCEMLNFVRNKILSYYDENINYSLSDNEIYNKKFGLFVTLKKGGDLRGCIGYVVGVKPIKEAVEDMAIQAAFHDPRFIPVQYDEIKELDIEISILSPLIEVNSYDEIKIGRDGLIVQNSGKSGLLLPQVAVEYGWDRDTFLKQTCLKAGLSSNCIDEKNSRFFRFEALVFSESELDC